MNWKAIIYDKKLQPICTMHLEKMTANKASKEVHKEINTNTPNGIDFTLIEEVF